MNKFSYIIALLLMCIAIPSFADEVKLPQVVITTDGNLQSTEFVNGMVSITDVDGSNVTLHAKYRRRGATALSYEMKPSLTVKIRTDEDKSLDSCLLGLRSCSKWILDAMAIDRICMRNRVCMDIWNDYASLPYSSDFPVQSSTGATIYRHGTIGKFVEVTINGEYKGIYVLSDNINRKLLNIKKPDVNDETKEVTVRGVLYKNGTTDMEDQNTPKFLPDYTAATVEYHNAWELKEPEDYECFEAWEPLVDAMGSSLAKGQGEKVSSYDLVKKYFFIDNLIDYQLHVMALSIDDNWGNKNHFLSIRNIQSDINSSDQKKADQRKFVISPWDLDTSLGGAYDGHFYDGVYSHEFTPEAAVKNGGCFPFHLCQGSSEYRERMKQRWEEVRLTSYLPANVNARMEEICNLFVNSGAWKRNGTIQPCYVNDLAKEVAYIEEWYAQRYQMMDAFFGITSGIEEIATDDDKSSEPAYYTLDGKRVSAPAKPGLYINSQKRKVVKVGL